MKQSREVAYTNEKVKDILSSIKKTKMAEEMIPGSCM
jgi:hypothetical protein